MSNYKKQEHDFIIRTKEIIKQYDDFIKKGNVVNEDKIYDTTLLLNCFVGLLILPQQVWYNYLPSEDLCIEEWGLNPENISLIKEDKNISVKNVVRHLRNSVSHYYFKAFSNDDKDISHIKFSDYTNTKNPISTFEARIPVSEVRDFVSKFSSYMINKMTENS
jgi:hypothetical protein